MATVAPFTINPLYSGVSVAYKNQDMIADMVLPRVPVPTQIFNYRTFTLGENMTVPRLLVGRTGSPARVEFSESETEATALDYGLEDAVPQKDVENAPQGYDPLGIATEGITDLLALGREIRAAAVVFGAGNYATGYKTTLSGVNQWSDAASNPIAAIEDAKNLAIMPFNTLVLGAATFTALRRHAMIVNAVRKLYAQDGLVTAADLSALFEVNVVVGRSWYNSAEKGQTVSLARVWGKHAALLHIGQGGGPRGRMTFGFTGQFGNRIAMTKFDDNIGLRGSQVVKVGESVVELAIANTLGYLFTNATA